MKWIKAFESFESEYYSCNSCNSIYTVYGPKGQCCKYCSSKDVTLMNKDEYYSQLSLRGDNTEEIENHKDDINDLERGSDDIRSNNHKINYLDSDQTRNWIGKD